MSVNTSDISLISKVPNPKHVTHLRSISLCNTSCYKFLTKIKVNMLNLLMSDRLGPLVKHVSFLLGINDNVLSMEAMLHSIHKILRKNSLFAVKGGPMLLYILFYI